MFAGKHPARMELLFVWIALWLFGAYLGQRRGRTMAGFWWAFFLGPIGWLIILLGPNPKKETEDAAKRAQEQRVENLQRQHLEELRALRATISGSPHGGAISETEYYLRQDGKIRGPLGKTQLLELFASRRIDSDTEVAPASAPTSFRPLGAEIPITLRS